MNHKRVIINIRFNNYPFKGFRHISRDTKNKRLTKEWIDYRMSVFMKYTLMSLKNQTNQNFLALIIYDDRSEQWIKEALKAYAELPEHVLMVKESESMNHMAAYAHGHPFFYLVYLDSDDMYHKRFIQRLHEFEPKSDTVALINQKGYVYDSQNGGLTSVDLKCPSFFTIIYKTDDFFQGKRYEQPRQDFALSLPHEIIPNRNYVIVLHKMNTVSQISLRGIMQRLRSKKIENPSEINKILKKFGQR